MKTLRWLLFLTLAINILLLPSCSFTAKPEDEDFMKMIDSESFRVIENRLWPDQYWTVRNGQFTSFQVHEINPTLQGEMWVARISFIAQGNGNGVSVEGLVRYRLIEEEAKEEESASGQQPAPTATPTGTWPTPGKILAGILCCLTSARGKSGGTAFYLIMAS